MVARADGPRYYDLGTHRHCPMVLVPVAKRTAPVRDRARGGSLRIRRVALSPVTRSG